jgi:phosphatidate cytidylyltransferase
MAVAFPALYLLLGIPAAFVALCLLVISAAGWEYAAMIGSSPRGNVGFGAATVVVSAAFLWIMRPGSRAPEDFALALASGILVWLFAAAMIRNAGRTSASAGGGPGWWTTMYWATRGIAWFGILPAFLALILLRHGAAGRGWVLLVLAASWGSDVGGYLVGRAWGRHRIAPSISPSKTLEGYLGGLALAGILLAALGHSGAVARPVSQVLAIGLPATVLAVLGDLAESWLKRRHGIVDSGRLLPGHGGILDCIDGLCFAAPWVYLVSLR